MKFILHTAIAVVVLSVLAEPARALTWNDNPICRYHQADHSKRCTVGTQNANLSAPKRQLLVYQCLINPNNPRYGREFIAVEPGAGKRSKLAPGLTDAQGSHHYSVMVQLDNNQPEAMTMMTLPGTPLVVFFDQHNYMGMIDRILSSGQIRVSIPYASGAETVRFILSGAKNAAQRALEMCRQP